MTFENRMNDFAFEIVSEPEAKTETQGSDYEAILLEVKADEILQELRGA
jgi:hypothetical protein